MYRTFFLLAFAYIIFCLKIKLHLKAQWAHQMHWTGRQGEMKESSRVEGWLKDYWQTESCCLCMEIIPTKHVDNSLYLMQQSLLHLACIQTETSTPAKLGLLFHKPEISCKRSFSSRQNQSKWTVMLKQICSRLNAWRME